MPSSTLEQALARFGMVTVLEPTFQALKKENGTWVDDTAYDPFTLDTLSISNFTQEGPTKVSKGGLNAEIVLRYGKTARLEMEDVVGRWEALTQLFGSTISGEEGGDTTETPITEVFTTTEGQETLDLKYPIHLDTSTYTVVVEEFVSGSNSWSALTEDTDYTAPTEDDESIAFITLTHEPEAGDRYRVSYTYLRPDTVQLKVTDKFATMFEITGRTFVVNASTGEREFVNITIPKFLPDSLLNLTMEAEGDFGVMSLAGELFTDDCGTFYYFSLGDAGTQNCV